MPLDILQEAEKISAEIVSGARPFNEIEDIYAILKLCESGPASAEVCRRVYCTYERALVAA